MRATLLLSITVAFLASCCDLTHADSALQVHDASPNSKFTQDCGIGRNLRGTHEAVKINDGANVADEEERGMQVIKKLKSILGRDPNKVSKKKLEKVRSYAEETPDKWYAMAYYLDYLYGISLAALLVGGAFGFGLLPAGIGGPRTN
ncbi:unnamed protein product [Phytophthora fragariaefolia]|uniref:RxLR effector protein n=1 Tax=Phytophthora fragariaefolia TaxID=1490495 RepID=A0A9W6TUR6_9STRA|nr:unnamed protein product [Phytophthora fragariaefolia]